MFQQLSLVFNQYLIIVFNNGITNVPWSKGRALVWDVTCADTLAKSYYKNINTKPGNAGEQAVIRKHRLYEEIKRNYEFKAIAFETLGPWSKEAQGLISVIGKKLITTSGDIRSRYYFIQRLSRRGNHECVTGTLPTNENFDEIFYI